MISKASRLAAPFLPAGGDRLLMKALVLGSWLALAVVSFAQGPPDKLEPVFIATGSFVAVSPDGKKVAYGQRVIGDSREDVILLCDAATGKEIRRLKAPPGLRPQAAVFSPDARLLAVGYDEATLCLWDTAQAGEPRHLEGSDGWDGERFAFSPDGKVLACSLRGQVGAAGIMHLWDVATGKELRRFGTGGFGSIATFAFSSDPTLLIAEHHQLVASTGPRRNKRSTYHITAHLWDTVTGKELGSVGKVTEWFDYDYRRFPTGQKLREISAETDGFRVRGGPLGQLMILPRCREITVAVGEKTLALTDLITGQERVHFQPFPGGSISTAVLSRQENTLAAAGESEKGGSLIAVWNVGAVKPRELPHPLSAEELEAFWKTMGDSDVLKAHAAACALAGHPDQVVLFLEKRLWPMASEEIQHLKQLLDELGDDRFAVREAAEQELEKRGEDAMFLLRPGARNPDYSLEARRRVRRIMERVEVHGWPAGETLRSLWAVELLEHLATPTARRLLERLGHGAPDAWLTQEAKASLARMGK
jgi:hypothetical protein